MSDFALPSFLTPLVDDLERATGAVAVVLGGSRAAGTSDATSDWDIGVYYRGALDLAPLRRWGEVHAPGAWGRLMNGGAWLTIDGRRVDVILRDADVVRAWTERAQRGEFEVDGLLGYVAGVPTYSLAAERAVARVLRGAIDPPIAFPEPLAESAARRWSFAAGFTLYHARSRATRGDVVGACAQAARAAIEASHARLCARREWVLNEKGLVERAGLGAIAPLFHAVPKEPRDLVEWVERIEAGLQLGGSPQP